MATPRPKAVATSASAIPAETAPMPPEPVRAMPWKALMMPITVPNRPMKGVMVAMVASEPMPRFRSEVVSSVARSTARGGLHDLRLGERAGLALVLEGLQACRHDAGQVALGVLAGGVDGGLGTVV